MKKCILCDAAMPSNPDLHVCLTRFKNGKRVPTGWYSALAENQVKQTKLTKKDLLQLAALRIKDTK
jgi:hypothetical protein